MFPTKGIHIIMAVMALCLISQSTALKCYSCNSKKSCNSPQLIECNQKTADDSRDYLLQNHTLVNPSITSSNYSCFREFIHTSKDWTYHKGCIYSIIDVCTLPIIPYNSSSLKATECLKCNSRDGCNPAGRANSDLLTALTAITFAIILRYEW